MKDMLLITWLLTLLAYSASPQTIIKAVDAYQYVGKKVVLQDSVRSHKDLVDKTLLYVGGAYAKPLLTVVYKGNANSFFKDVDRKLITVIGIVVSQRDGLEIIVDDPELLTVRETHILN